MVLKVFAKDMVCNIGTIAYSSSLSQKDNLLIGGRKLFQLHCWGLFINALVLPYWLSFYGVTILMHRYFVVYNEPLKALSLILVVSCIMPFPMSCYVIHTRWLGMKFRKVSLGLDYKASLMSLIVSIDI